MGAPRCRCAAPSSGRRWRWQRWWRPWSSAPASSRWSAHRTCTGRTGPSNWSCRRGRCRPAIGAKVLARVSGLADYAGGNYGQVSVAAPGSGSARRCLRSASTSCTAAGSSPCWRAGPRPGRMQIALGPRTLHTLGLHVGQWVKVSANGRAAWMRIVGSAVFAAFSVGGGSSTDLGTGAAVAASVLSQPNPAVLHRPRNLLQLLPAAVPAGHRPARRGGRLEAAVPAPDAPGPVPGDHRPAARRHPELHGGPGHPAGPRRRPRRCSRWARSPMCC